MPLQEVKAALGTQESSKKIMKIATLFISLLLIMFACRPAKNIQRTAAVISRVDTTKVVVIKDNKTADSARFIKDVYNKVIKNKINFTTFTAKVRAAYSSKEENEEATAYIRLQKDSALWVSLRGPLGIEGFRILITTDSVKVMNILKKNIQYRSIDFLQQVTGIPFDFAALQDMIVGNPVFIDSNINSYTSDSTFLQIVMTGRLFKHLATLDRKDYKIVESKLNDINHINRTCNIEYSGYDTSSGVPFSTERKISLTDESKLNINLNFKQYTFNHPITFPFNVTGNYKRL
jgi:hypothetical protein